MLLASITTTKASSTPISGKIGHVERQRAEVADLPHEVSIQVAASIEFQVPI